MADATDSKSVGGNPMRVRLSPRASSRHDFAATTPNLTPSVGEIRSARCNAAGHPANVKMDPHGVSEQNPVGIAEFRSGRWRALEYADMSVPPSP